MASRLAFDERCVISAMVGVGETVQRIADELDRHPSTVRREINRCGGRDYYRAEDAQADAEQRARRPKVPKLAGDPLLAEAVAERLEMRWSPHAVAADLRGEGRRVCAETIYQACYDPAGRRGLTAGSWRWLPRHRRRRKPRSRCEQAKRQPLGDIKPITSRPPTVETRVEAGHWEGDLIIGARNGSAVATLTERVTRHTLLVELPHGYKAPQTAQAIIEAFSSVPPPLKKTLTWDQGREMADWTDIEEKTGLTVYFCEPRSPWQRGTNEHTNGMIRRWLPKSTNLNIGQIPLAIIEDSLNLMPRRLHNWNSPHDLYNQLKSNHR